MLATNYVVNRSVFFFVFFNMYTTVEDQKVSEKLPKHNPCII